MRAIAMISVIARRGILVTACLGLTSLAGLREAAALSGTFKTAPGAMALFEFHSGTWMSATIPLDVTLDFVGPPTLLTATIHEPIIGFEALGLPTVPPGTNFPLTITATSTDNRHFEGVLFSQYFFSWDFDAAAGGGLLWNGSIDWVGGRAERTTISSARLQSVVIPEPTTLCLITSGVALALLRKRPRGARC
jgi:hypothetical protein